MRPGDGAFPWVKLTYVAKPGTGHTPGRQRPELWQPGECVIPWFTLGDVWRLRDDTVTTAVETEAAISEAGLASSSAVLHPRGTVLLSRTASVGFSAVMGRDMAVSQDFMTWTPGLKLRSRYLLYVLRALRPYLRGLMYGSTHKTIYMPDLLALKVPLPPTPMQELVSDFLDRECARIGDLDAALRSMETCRAEWMQSRVDEIVWAGQQPTVPLRWSGCTCVTGPFGTVLSSSEYVTNGVPLINPTHIRDGIVVPSFHETVSEKTAARLSRHRLQVGDLVVGRKGDLGRTALIGEPEQGWLCGSDSIALRPDRGRFSPEFLLQLMRTSHVRHDLLARSSGATVPNMNEHSLLDLRAPSISAEQQRARVRILTKERAHAEMLQRQLGNLRVALSEYRDALIAEAVTGQLDVSKLSNVESDDSAQAAMDGPRPEVLSG